MTSAAGSGIWGKKDANGRVSAEHLYAFNQNLKKEHLKERHYWSENKDLHPINRYQYQQWEDRNQKESMFLHKFNSIPVDQQFKFKKLMSTGNVNIVVPIFAATLLFWSYLRYKVWGITAVEGQKGTLRNIMSSSRAPGANS